MTTFVQLSLFGFRKEKVHTFYYCLDESVVLYSQFHEVVLLSQFQKVVLQSQYVSDSPILSLPESCPVESVLESTGSPIELSRWVYNVCSHLAGAVPVDGE